MSIAVGLLGLAVAALAYRLGYCAGYRNGQYDAGRLFGKELSMRATTAAGDAREDELPERDTDPKVLKFRTATRT